MATYAGEQSMERVCKDRDIPSWVFNQYLAKNLEVASSTITKTEYGLGWLKHTKLVCTALPITITDASGSCQWGGAKLGDFPEGLIVPLACVVGGTLTLGTTGTITDTWEGICSVGTTAATNANATLTATEANIIASTAVAAAKSKVATIAALSTCTGDYTDTGAMWIDGTTTAADLYLNLIVTDSATHTSGTGTFTGTIYLSWLWGGDK